LDKLEKDLRTPSLELIPEFAGVLELPVDLLYCALGLFSPGLLEDVETRDQLLSALQIFRQAILSHEGQNQNDAYPGDSLSSVIVVCSILGAVH